MHPINFAMKQGHLAGMRFSRPETEAVDLTPARLDMLRTVLEQGGSVTQSYLWRLLGVTKPVVSIMVRALERLGFVLRERRRHDRRTFDVSLTPLAVAALRKIFYQTRVTGFLPLILHCVLVPRRISRRRFQRYSSRLRLYLGRFREQFGIGDTSYNPWTFSEDDEGFYFEDVPGNPNRIDIVPNWDERRAAAGRPVDDPILDERDPTSPTCNYDLIETWE